MPTKPIERLLFAQGGLCFFCEQKLSPADASIEHLVATSNGGRNGEENTVACCKSLNALFGRMSLKDKLRVILNQKGDFKCPNSGPKVKSSVAVPGGAYERVMANLEKHGAARPRTVKKLASTINNLFQKSLSSQQLDLIISKLKARGVIEVDGIKVSYKFTAGA